MNCNIDVETGIHFGVIPLNDLSEWAWEDIANNGTDLDWEEYQEETKHRIEAALSDLQEYTPKSIKAALEPLKVDYYASLINRIIDACDHATCQDDAIEEATEEFENSGGDYYEQPGDCTRYRYTEDGLDFQVCGDGDIFVLKSPFISLAATCSPCAPNAGYLKNAGSLPTYCLGPDWFDDDKIPYLYMRTEDWLKTGQFVALNLCSHCKKPIVADDFHVDDDGNYACDVCLNLMEKGE